MIHCILLSIFGYMASDCFILASWGHINGFPLSDNSYILSAFYAKIVSFHPVQLEVIFSLSSVLKDLENPSLHHTAGPNPSLHHTAG